MSTEFFKSESGSEMAVVAEADSTSFALVPLNGGPNVYTTISSAEATRLAIALVMSLPTGRQRLEFLQSLPFCPSCGSNYPGRER